MNLGRNKLFVMTALTAGLCLFAMLGGCSDDRVTDSGSDTTGSTITDGDFQVSDWSTATHGKEAAPDFDEVFADNAVKRMDIVITAARWQSMLDNMTELYGSSGTGTGTGGGGGPGGPGGPPALDATENPIFVPAEVFYADTEWYRVGIRFKGNSSLQSTWQSGNLKLSFKLDFDEFEDDYPQIKNQRFYGFKKLSLKNNYQDKSMLREKVAGDVFRQAGLPGSHTAFYALYVDHGTGPVYFGLYTMVEEVDDTVLKTQFTVADGNLYKPDGSGASFAAGTFNQIDLVKKNNEDAADWSDVSSLYSVLHDGTRTTDPPAWRAALETVFDTDAFLEYLAVNTVIQNWDTYGRMTHNYYLYNNPATGQLTWINWDNNEALQAGNMQGALALDFADLAPGAWPLIEYLYADSTYRARYDAYVDETINGAFAPSDIQAVYTAYAALVEPFATSEISGHTFLNSPADFQAAVSELMVHATARSAAAESYLAR